MAYKEKRCPHSTLIHVSMFNDIILPTYVNVRESIDRKSDVPERGILLIDGEREQVDVCTQDSMLTKLNDVNLDVLKLSASCSGIQQPEDVGPIFRSVKSFIKKLTYSNDLDEDVMKETRIAIEKLGIKLGKSTKDRILRWLK